MKISTIAKYVDQPIVLSKLHKKMPYLLVASGAVVGAYDYHKCAKKHKRNRKTHFMRNTVVISSTICASLLGTRGLKINGKKIFNGLMENIPLKDLQVRQAKAVGRYLTNSNLNNAEVLDALHAAKERELSPKQIQLLIDKLPDNNKKNDLFDVILPKKKNLNSKEIFAEIGRLSLLGLIPVVGGISGGLIADFSTHTNTKKRTANMVKEGLYQYLANIFL